MACRPLLSPLAAALGAVLPTQDAQDDRLTAREFERLHAALRPTAGDAWRTIPWRLSLLAGQRTAAKERKPIFIWAMDGHPLACT